jgi:hypothetical protein
MPVKQKLDEVRNRYDQISTGQTLKRVRELRHNAIAHLLLKDKALAIVEYFDIFALVEEIERLVITLYEGFGNIPPPNFLSLKEQTVEQAKLFWQTYFAGAAALST